MVAEREVLTEDFKRAMATLKFEVMNFSFDIALDILRTRTLDQLGQRGLVYTSDLTRDKIKDYVFPAEKSIANVMKRMFEYKLRVYEQKYLDRKFEEIVKDREKKAMQYIHNKHIQLISTLTNSNGRDCNVKISRVKKTLNNAAEDLGIDRKN